MTSHRQRLARQPYQAETPSSSPPDLQDTALEKMLSAFSTFETQHYGNPREQANAIALRGEKELLTAQAMHQHAKELRAALAYDANSTKASSKATAKIGAQGSGSCSSCG